MVTCEGFEPDPHTICDDAEHVFTAGQCHTLASAIADRTGLSVYVLYSLGEPMHAVVGLAPGIFGDVRGVHRREELLAVWCCDEVRSLTFDAEQTDINEATQDFYDREGDIECEREAAYAFAPTVEQLWREELPQLATWGPTFEALRIAA
jgi:hypothetical protein